MSERIRVSGFPPPITLPGRRHRVRSVALVRPANLIGLLGAAGVLVAVSAWGTPHMLLSSTYSGSGAYRFYTDCAYAGLDRRVLHLRGRACPFFRLLKPQGS